MIRRRSSERSTGNPARGRLRGSRARRTVRRIELLEPRTLLVGGPSTLIVEGGYSPTFDANSAGVSVVAYSALTGPNHYDVFAQRFDGAGVANGPPIAVNMPVTDRHLSSSVALDAAGNFVVTWTTSSYVYQPQNVHIYARLFAADGPPRDDQFRVDGPEFMDGYSNEAAVGMDDDGDFVIVWRGLDIQYSYGVYAQRYDATGAAVGTTILAGTNSTSFNSVTNPAVAVDADGDFIVAWSDHFNGVPFGRYYSGVGIRNFHADGTPRSSQQSIPMYSDAPHVPDVSISDDGHFALAWVVANFGYATYSGDRTLYVQQFGPDGIATGNHFSLTDDAAQLTPLRPRIALASDGPALLAYSLSGNTWGQWIGADGFGLGAPLLVDDGQVSDLFVKDTQEFTVLTGWSAGLYRRVFSALPSAIPPWPGAIFTDTGVVIPDQGTLNVVTSTLSVGMSQSLSNATQLEHWRLTRDGQDVSHLIYHVDTGPYGAYKFNARITLASALPAGEYELIARETLTNDDGIRLDGDRDGISGGNAVLQFVVTTPADLTPPTVIDVRGENGTVITQDSVRPYWTNELDIRFSERMSPVDNQSPFNARNWSLFRNGNDVSHVIESAQRAPGSFDAVRLTLRDKLPPGAYRLELRSAVSDLAGNLHDGDGDGVGGDAFELRFHAPRTAPELSFMVDPTPRNQYWSSEGSSVAIDSDGDIHVAWNAVYYNSATHGRDREGLYRRYRADGSPLTAPIPLGATSGSHVPEVVIDSDSDVWILASALYVLEADPQGNEYLRRLGHVGLAYATIAILPGGGFVVAGIQRGYLEERLAFQRLDADGAFVGPQVIVEELPFAGGTQYRPSIAVDGSGGFALVWGHISGGDPIFAQRFSPDNTPIGIKYAVGHASLVANWDVVGDAQGNFNVVWEDFGNVNLLRFDAMGVPMSPASVVTSLSYPSTHIGARIAMDSAGRFVVSSQAGLQSFHPDGTPDGDPWPLIGGHGIDVALGREGFVVVAGFDGGQILRPAASGPPRVILSGVTASNFAGPHEEYSVPMGSGEQLRTIPVGGLDTIRIEFNEWVDIAADDLTISGAQHGVYAFADFSFDPLTFIATWRLAVPIEADRVTLLLDDRVSDAIAQPLDGEWANPVSIDDPTGSTTSGDLSPGGRFLFRMTVLPGDANRDNRVTGADYTLWADGFGTSPAKFSDGDFNGDGFVTGSDYTLWANQFGLDLRGPPEPIIDDDAPIALLVQDAPGGRPIVTAPPRLDEPPQLAEPLELDDAMVAGVLAAQAQARMRESDASFVLRPSGTRRKPATDAASAGRDFAAWNARWWIETQE